MEKTYILAHDLGTSGDKATLYDSEGRLCASSFGSYETFYLEGAGVEQDANEWWRAVCETTQELLGKAGIRNTEIACITFSAQMMGALPVDKDGTPLRRSIIWADLRSGKQVDYFASRMPMEEVYRITGHRLTSSYSATKLLWVRDNEPEIYKRTYKVLQAKDFIVQKLTGAFVTDYSDACGTNLFDILKRRWSKEILASIDLPEGILPDAHASTDIVGHVTEEAARATGLAAGTPVVIGGGDGSCAATGAGAVEPGLTYNVIGSSSWIAMATEEPIFDPKMQTFNWVHLDEKLYSPCGTMQAAGYSFSWLKETLCAYESDLAKRTGTNPYDLIEAEVEKSEAGSRNLLFLPYLLGERSPRWNPQAKGAFVGLTISHTKGDVYRSVIEGVSFNLKVILDTFNQMLPIDEVIVIGGAARSKVWLRILSDIWQKPVLRPRYLEEATSLGAAVCGGVATGIFPDFRVARKFNDVVETIKPNPERRKRYEELYAIFNETYDALVPVYERLSHL